MRPEHWVYTIPLRLRSLFRRRQADQELDEELRDHIEHKTEEFLARGMMVQEARRAALLEMGGVEKRKEECRETRRVSLIQDFLHDTRYALRMLRKSPGFTAVAVLTMALGIGATTAIFSVVDATLLRPLPYPQPEQLVSIQDDLSGVGARDVGLNRPEYQDLQHSGIFQYVSPTWYDENNLTGSSQPVTVRLLIEAPNYFALLGVKPQLGRAFDPDDDRPGFTGEVVISDGLWKRLFGKDPRVLEKSIRLDTDLYQIVGIMPPGFHAPGRTAAERDIEVWAPTSFYGPPLLMNPPRNRRNIPEAIARLKPGLTVAEAQSRVDALVASLEKQFPGDYPAQSAWRVRLVPLKETVFGNVRESLLLLLGAVGLVLLIGCVNVANLLLARASARGREMAIRQALGGAQGRLVRQLLTESVLLSLLGGIAGMAILFCLKGFLLRLVPESLPRLGDVSISWSVLLFALLASLVAGVFFGLAPALQTRKLDVIHVLKQEGRASTGSGRQARTRRVLVVTEFALSLVLMIAASLLLRSFWDLLNARLGFQPENAMSVRTRLPYPNDVSIDKYDTAAKEAPFIREVMRRCKALPGVEEVAIGDSESIPLDRSARDMNVIAEGQFLMLIEGHAVQSDQPAVERTQITPEYFGLLGMPLLRGRLFNDLDDDKTPQVAVVNEAFARTYFPNADPLGKRFKQSNRTAPWITIVGVIANARVTSLAEENVPQIYLDLYQTTSKHLAILLQGHLNIATIPEEVREQVQAVDPTLPVFGAQTLNEALSASLAERRFSMRMIGVFALTALLLSSLGIYGVISYIVSERTHEIGIRLALGAQRSHIVQMVLRQGLGLALAGAGVGLVGAAIVSRLMAGLLYGVQPTDALTFLGDAILLTAVALVASYIPARRAVRVDPLVALKYE
jgi:predicted permease